MEFSIINHPLWGSPIYGNLLIKEIKGENVWYKHGEFTIKPGTV
jgi:hypothetical protein